MDKKTFKKLMTDFIKIRKDEENLHEAMRRFDSDFGGFSLGKYECLWLETMKEAMDDEYDYLSYWIYELDFGKKAKKNSITEKNGTPIPIKTLDNLYDIIKNK
jgi:hypothetical protein